MLLLPPTSSYKLLAKWQGTFVVTRQVGDLYHEARRTDRGDLRQIYHLNLLKRWNEVTWVELAEEDLVTEAALKAARSGPGEITPRC